MELRSLKDLAKLRKQAETAEPDGKHGELDDRDSPANGEDEGQCDESNRQKTEHEATAHMKQGLLLALTVVPHLAPLAYSVSLQLDTRVATAGVFASGLILVNAGWILRLTPLECAFVLAHELLHLAFDTHERSVGAPQQLANIAHDWVINDVLEEVFGFVPPAGGLRKPGARFLALEGLVIELLSDRWDYVSWTPLDDGRHATPSTGGIEPRELDLLPEELEREWFPQRAPRLAEQQEAIRHCAAKAAALGVLTQSMTLQGKAPGESNWSVQALHNAYRPPWELALQRWVEDVAPGKRSFSRPSRRSVEREDVVLPGRRREGWTLHLVLDTSGSMVEELPRLFGLIASFSESAGVDTVHILQCDADLQRDERLEIAALRSFEVEGGGGSDLTPAMLRLAADPEVNAAIVLTDGFIGYPRNPVPYQVLWVLSQSGRDFSPRYGQCLRILQ